METAVDRIQKQRESDMAKWETISKNNDFHFSYGVGWGDGYARGLQKGAEIVHESQKSHREFMENLEKKNV